jgi:hypothetical protein
MWDGVFKDYAYQTVLFIINGLMSFHFSTTICSWTNDYLKEEEAKGRNVSQFEDSDDGTDDPTGLRRIERAIVQHA